MKKLIVYFIVAMFAVQNAFALKADFTSISKYHQEQVKQLLADYTLEDSLNIRIELKKKEGKLEEQEVVSLPGIHYKVGESAEENIEKVLNLYERKVVFIMKRQVSEQELTLVKSSLSERLFLGDDFQFTMLDDIPKVNDAVNNLKNDFVVGAYSTLIQKGQFLWIIIFSLGFILALWILAKVWKAKSEGSGGEISMAGGSAAPEASQVDKKENNNEGISAQAASSSEFETFNFTSLCENINDAFNKSPGGCANILWSNIPDLASQIQFFEIIRIQKSVSPEIMATTQSSLDAVFSYEKRADQKSSRRNAKSFGKNTLSQVSVELAKLKFMSLNKDLDSAYNAIYPDKGDHLEEVFSQGAKEHYLVLYKLFNEDFMNYLSNQSSDDEEDSGFLNIMNDILTFDPETDDLEASQYESFVSFVNNLSVNDESNTKSGKSVNSKVVNMIYGLSEDEITKVKAMKDNEDLKAQVPTFEWIISEDLGKLKDFINALNGAEISCLMSKKSSFEEDMKKLDDRMQFKIKERMRKDSGVSINWRQFRDKIANNYSYNDGSDKADDELSKAS